MSKNIIIGIIIVAGILGAYAYSSKNSQMSPPLTSPIPEVAKGVRRVLFFHATWCPTCIAAQLDFEKNKALLPVDLEIIRVNYNDSETDASEKALATKYGIVYQHTFVQVDGQGLEVVKWNGGSTKELLARIK